ncbi:MAG: glycosyltransferase, partial [DPANN group archaeon]|nr:glycosyltransferase [DPANN group archaeon]
GETVIFFDNDSVAQQNYLKTLFKFLADHPEIDIVGGPQTNSAEGSFFARAGGATLTSFFGTFTMSSRYKKTKLNLGADEFSLTTANVAIRKKIFGKIAPFNTNIYPGEDPELFARAKNSGFKIAFDPEIAVTHGRRPTLKAFCKMFFVYGRTRVIKEQATPTPFPKSLLFALPSLFLISLFALPLLSYFTKLFLLPFAVYILAAVSFSVEAAIYNRVPLAFLILPFLFICVHVCYGAGYLVGLTKKKQKFDAHDVYKGDT